MNRAMSLYHKRPPRGSSFSAREFPPNGRARLDASPRVSARPCSQRRQQKNPSLNPRVAPNAVSLSLEGLLLLPVPAVHGARGGEVLAALLATELQHLAAGRGLETGAEAGGASARAAGAAEGAADGPATRSHDQSTTAQSGLASRHGGRHGEACAEWITGNVGFVSETRKEAGMKKVGIDGAGNRGARGSDESRTSARTPKR